jgi:hypothetical protein
MWLEILKPVALTLCMLSLYAVFHTAFLVPGNDLQQRISDSLELLALAGGISLVGGMIFLKSEPEQSGNASLFATLPFRVFFWTTTAMVIFFLASWYLESHCVFYRDVRPWR